MTVNDLHCLPISSRPSHGLRQLFRTVLFNVIFLVAILLCHFTQYLIFPLRIFIAFFPNRTIHHIYENGIRATKGWFGKTLVFICQFFAPTSFVITYEGDNLNDDLFTKDASGRIVKFNLPDKLVIMSNHQIYADWLYLWSLLYMGDLDTDVLILLKKSLKWIPIVGWSMQAFHFIFLSRSWASDRSELTNKLAQTAIRARSFGTPLALIIYPEGTLVSPDTRPISRKFAEKINVDDPQHMLLPRSTGLFYCLRALAPQIPELKLLDITINYEGIPRGKYGQSYYTLRSIFMHGCPSPRIHLHLRLYDVVKDVPVGNLIYRAETNATASTNTLSRPEIEKNNDPTPEESAVFDEWLRKLWYQKDALYERCLSTGTFECRDAKRVTEDSNGVLTAATSASTTIPLKFRSNWHILQTFSYFIPIILSCSIYYLCT